MSKQAEKDLFIFLEALRPSQLRGFKRMLLSSSNKNSTIKHALVEKIVTGDSFKKEDFLKTTGLSEKQYSTLKFQLFKELLNYLKFNYDQYSDVALHNNIIEYEILLNKGLYNKALKRYNMINEIAIQKCDFNACCTVQIKAIENQLYRYMQPTETLVENTERLRKFQMLSDNLLQYKLLSSEVVYAYHISMNSRARNKNDILEYLEHPLLQDVSQAKSTLAVFYFYRAKSILCIADNEFQKSKEHSLKAYLHLKENLSPYRNDYLKSLMCLNNYMHSSFQLKETEPYEIMYPQIVDIVERSSETADTYSTALSFIILAGLKLNYFRITENTEQFLKEADFFIAQYNKYSSILRPSFKPEFIFNMARMYFLAGELKTANEYCKKIAHKNLDFSSEFVSCTLLLRIMINFDLENYEFLPHLVSTSKYSLEKRNRLFDMERMFLKSFSQIKTDYSQDRHQHIFDELYTNLAGLDSGSDDFILSEKMGLLEWVKEKSSFSNQSAS